MERRNVLGYTIRYKTANTGSRMHPFIDGIMKVHLPPRWKTLNIDRYDGLSDPDEHVGAFMMQMNLFTNEDALMC